MSRQRRHSERCRLANSSKTRTKDCVRKPNLTFAAKKGSDCSEPLNESNIGVLRKRNMKRIHTTQKLATIAHLAAADTHQHPALRIGRRLRSGTLQCDHGRCGPGLRIGRRLRSGTLIIFKSPTISLLRIGRRLRSGTLSDNPHFTRRMLRIGRRLRSGTLLKLPAGQIQ